MAVVSVSLLTGDAESKQDGMTGRTETGCVCHSATPMESVRARLSGLPDKYEPGKEYELVVSYTGGPPAGPGPRAGFDLLITGGQFSSEPSSVTSRISFEGDEATHSEVGNRESSWPLKWTAPEEGTGAVEATLVVNVVNGNGNPDPGDQWARLRLTVQEEGSDDGGAGTLLWVGLILVVAFLAAVFLLGVRRGSSGKSRSGRTRSGKRGKRRRGRRR